MPAFDLDFEAVALPLLLEQFGELIEYHPRVGRPRVIQAIVDRRFVEPIPGVARTSGPSLRVTCYDNDLTGIAIRDVDTGGDKIKVAWRKNGTPELVGVSRIESQACGTTLVVR